MKLMRIVMVAGLLAGSPASFAAPYKLDTAHLEVGFQVTHMMISKVKGRFTKVEGGFDFDDKKNELKAVDVKIEAGSITTENQKRDDHLRSPDFFDTKKFPAITFKGEKVEMKDGKPAKVIGTLTMHGVSKPVVLDVELRGSMMNQEGLGVVGFSANGKINRQDFGVKFNKNLDKGGVAVSDEVVITIDGEAVQEKAAKK